MNFKQKSTDILKTIFPSEWNEFFLFIFFLTIYGILGSFIALNYRIIFDNRIPWDAYFSFDNRAIIMTGGGFERHPLSNYFFDGIRNFAFWISNGKMDSTFRLVLALCSNFAVSLSLVQIFKYLKNIIKLPLKISLLIIAFFALFSTNILLSFTPETYTYTLFLLVLFNYFSALKLRKDEKISGVAMVLSTVFLGGLTITNAVKVYIPVLFEKKLFWNWKKILNAKLRVIISILIFALLYLNRLNFNYHLIFQKTETQYEKFSNPKITPLWDMISSWFFGGNILFSNFAIRDYHSLKGFKYKALFMDVYSSWIPYVFVVIVLILILWSYGKNFKNKLVQILMISFLVDVIIHCVLKFGLHTSYIYGGHFVFVYPLLLGWLFFAYKNSPKVQSILYAITCVLVVYLGINNFIRMEEFFDFLNAYYK
ncbi:DUF6080 domain-containing protein [Halpernia sp.]|uniref:DUF6080 domain-containing protein n=1 Tax=Halpernia sp. TaxID=2782209 RepID=UPI003A92766F